MVMHERAAVAAPASCDLVLEAHVTANDPKPTQENKPHTGTSTSNRPRCAIMPMSGIPYHEACTAGRERRAVSGLRPGRDAADEADSHPLPSSSCAGSVGSQCLPEDSQWVDIGRRAVDGRAERVSGSRQRLGAVAKAREVQERVGTVTFHRHDVEVAAEISRICSRNGQAVAQTR